MSSRNGPTSVGEGSNIHPYPGNETPPIRPTYLETGEAITNPPCSRKDQMEKVLHTVRERNAKIAVICNGIDSRSYHEDKAKATSIATELNQMLSGSKALVYEYEIKDREVWFRYVRSVQVTYYIFVNLPPYDPYHSTAESEFFHPASQRVTEVVVVRKRKTAAASTPGPRLKRHYLEKFQHLGGSPKDVAAKALCHFAACQPIPHPTDKVYWSELPKVYRIHKTALHNTLGITIMTREMAQKSHFPRIVVVKLLTEDCVPSLKDCVGMYTHIQSLNGILLDGLNIADATTIFQASTNSPSVQLSVRYVHPVNTLTVPGLLTGGVETMKTPVCLQDKAIAGRIDPAHEMLPISLMILGDIYVSCKELFRLLGGSMGGDSASLLSHTSDVDSQTSIQTGSNADSGTLTVTTNSTTLHVPSSSSRIVTRSEAASSHGDSREGSDVSMAESFPSDKYVWRQSLSRALMSSGNGGGSTLVSPSTTPVRTAQATHPPSFNRQNTWPHVDKRYILNMFTQKMDRRFIHLYLRQSGIYLVVVSLEDIIEDPVIQFENLSFWLRLVQTYVRPNEMKRLMIVGMSDGLMGGEREQECLNNLEGAIREADFQHVYNRENSSVVYFNRASPKASVECLCSAIWKCMDSMMQKAWHFYRREFFENVFCPFAGLTGVLHQMNQSQEIMKSADSLLSIYKYADPNYFDTLAAHSSALVDDRLDSLLKPGFLLDLLKKLSLNSENYEVFGHNISQLKGLPVVLDPWPKTRILYIHQNATDQQIQSIMKWAERFELFYSLGYSGKHEIYFIPLLATDFLADDVLYDWPEEEADGGYWYDQPETSTLYAKLNFPAIDHFFYAVLTEILKDVVNNVPHHNPPRKCYIGLGCKEAILPIHVPEVHSDIVVYLKYHLLQNVIEFRTNTKRQQYLYKVVDSKLEAAFNYWKHTGGRESTTTYKGAVTFHRPHNNYDPKFVTSALGRLCRLPHAAATPPGDSESGSLSPGDAPLPDVRVQSDDFTADHDQLLMMKRVTNNEWLSGSLDMKKKIPGNDFIQWGRRLSSGPDHWAIVASKLRLMSREDVDFYRNNRNTSGNGELVLSKWVDSGLTYKDLTDTLRCEEVRLNVLADEIEGFFGTDV